MRGMHGFDCADIEFFWKLQLWDSKNKAQLFIRQNSEQLSCLIRVTIILRDCVCMIFSEKLELVPVADIQLILLHITRAI